MSKLNISNLLDNNSSDIEESNVQIEENNFNNNSNDKSYNFKINDARLFSFGPQREKISKNNSCVKKKRKNSSVFKKNKKRNHRASSSVKASNTAKENNIDKNGEKNRKKKTYASSSQKLKKKKDIEHLVTDESTNIKIIDLIESGDEETDNKKNSCQDLNKNKKSNNDNNIGYNIITRNSAYEGYTNEFNFLIQQAEKYRINKRNNKNK